MAKKEISLGGFLDRINSLRTSATPVACTVIFTGGRTLLYGYFVESVTEDELVLASSQGMLEAASSLKLSLAGCDFVFADSGELADFPPNIEESLVLKYGNSALRVFVPSSETELLIFFTS